MGLDKRTSKVYDIDKDGNKILVYDRHKKKEDLIEIKEKTPFDDDIVDADGEMKF